MSVIGIMILSTAIGIGSAKGQASELNRAYKAAIKAAYIQSGSDKHVKVLEKQYIPKELKEYGGVITWTTKLLIEKKISYEWTF